MGFLLSASNRNHPLVFAPLVILYNTAPISSKRLQKGPSAQVRKSTDSAWRRRRSPLMGVDFSMGMTNLGTSFRPHLTRRMGSADTARQLRVTTFDHSTSTTTNRPPDQHFYPISVVRVDGKWVRGWNSVTAGRPAHSPGE